MTVARTWAAPAGERWRRSGRPLPRSRSGRLPPHGLRAAGILGAAILAFSMASAELLGRHLLGLRVWAQRLWARVWHRPAGHWVFACWPSWGWEHAERTWDESLASWLLHPLPMWRPAPSPAPRHAFAPWQPRRSGLRPRTKVCGRQAKFAFPSSTLLSTQDATWISFSVFNDSSTLTEYFSFESASLDVPSIFMFLLIESKTGLSVLYLWNVCGKN